MAEKLLALILAVWLVYAIAGSLIVAWRKRKRG